MYTSFRNHCTRLKRVVRRRKRDEESPIQIRPLSPELAPILQRAKSLSVIFDAGLQIASRDPKPTFLRIPYEIRRQIVEHCLCGINVRLNVAEEAGRIKQIIYIIPHDVMRKRAVLSLPLTCRQLYLETINLIYAGNTFRMGMALTVLALPEKIPSQRLNTLKDIWFQWHVHQPPVEGTSERKQWAKVWQILAALEGLKFLRIQIFPYVFFEDEWPKEEEKLLEESKYVTRPGHFKLELAWAEGPNPLQLPCSILRIPNTG